MPTQRSVLLACLALVALLGAALATREQDSPLAVLPATPSGVSLLAVHPFRLEEPFQFTWRKEAPLVDAGWILVLEADPELLRRRQTFEPVLYVGDQTAERCNDAWPAPYLVALVPGPTPSPVGTAFDAGSTRIWFGTPELPERVDAGRIAEESALATRSGIGLPDLSKFSRTRAGEAGTIHVTDRDELDFFIADLIEAYAPHETGRIQLLRMPRTR